MKTIDVVAAIIEKDGEILAHIEYDLTDVGFNDIEGHADGIRPGLHRAEILIGDAKISITPTTS